MVSPAQHPIHFQERIDRQGVVVAEVQSLPSGVRPFQSDNLVIGICLEGTADFMYDLLPRRFERRDVGVTLPNHIFTYSTVSPDYRATLIIISPALYKELTRRESFIDYQKYHNRPALTLTEEQFANVHDIVQVLRHLCEIEHPRRAAMLENLLDILFYALTRYRGEEDVEVVANTRGEQLFNRFYDLLLTHYNRHHTLIWYAEQLHLTPKHLSLTILRTTGKTPNTWITEMLTEQAKRWLDTHRDMTVQQVAYEFGFDESASFCRFFKRQTGMRPSEYRKRKK
ncbi:MAG: helix-turn-helix domain-containing protein [Paludibacteraceae bacterium]|nr:helix-turn-helix domain-containing protein [Paludibacteraceae bacterium]